jgi:hypothetical protein
MLISEFSFCSGLNIGSCLIIFAFLFGSQGDARRLGLNVCWWEKPLVVALKHSEGIKHTVLFQQ